MGRNTGTGSLRFVENISFMTPSGIPIHHYTCSRLRSFTLWTLLALGAIPFPAGAQAPAEPIDSFANRQDRLFVIAYEQRDIPAYTRLMAQWQVRYNSLPGDEKKQWAPYTMNTWYNFSCTYALAGNATRALDCLDSATRAGYADYGHLMQDPDLVSIRRDPRFITLAARLRATGDYLYILRKAGAYNRKDQRELPTFTYQPSTDPDLVALRKAFNLDSVAGTGNDASRALNLLHWVHNGVPHDGNHENPVVKNALSLVGICKKEGRGLNCRGLATVLNEAYLSIGFFSRMVTCLPKDSLGTDTDCHVIDMVFIPSLKKWIWCDPTHDAYLMDEKGRLLGIEEVRTRIIHNEPLILNPDANWNHRSSTEKEEYLYHYMAKNLYMLECPTDSRYDNETRKAGKIIPYIRLIPLDYFKQGPDKTEFPDTRTGTTLVIYKTNDPGKFWQAPPAAAAAGEKTGNPSNPIAQP